FFHLYLGSQQPGLAGGQHRGVSALRSGRVNDGEAAVVSSEHPIDGPERCTVMQPGKRGSLWPVSRIVYCSFPEPTGDLFRAASDEVLVVVELAGSDTQNLEHCIGEVGVPAAGTEADLSEDLPMAETEPRECFGGSDELIETVIIPPRNQFVPDPLDLRGITLPHRLLQLGQLQHRVQGQIV